MTQNQAILAHLSRGQPLTALQALKCFKVLRLASRVYDLRWAGHEIKQRMIEVNHKRVAQYWLVA